MTLEEKKYIAKSAQNLVYQLENCGDGEFVDFIISCVVSADTLSLEPECL